MFSRKVFASVSFVVIALAMVFTFQNCARIGLSDKQQDLQKALDTGGTNFACTEGTTGGCEVDGKSGTMKCVSTGEGTAWDQCVINGDDGTPGGTPLGSCKFKGNTYVHGQSFVAYKTASVAASGQCTSELRTCLNGALTGSYQNLTCVKQNGDCSVAGKTIGHGQSLDMYLTSSVGFTETCKKESRLCFNSQLSGSYTFLTCVNDAPLNCNLGGQTVPHGGTITAFLAEKVPSGTACVEQKRACFNGNLSGSYTALSCATEAPLDCTFNGQPVPNNTSVTAYKYAKVPRTTTCHAYGYSETRTCTNGVLSGSYTYGTCSVDYAKECYFNGMTVASGGSVRAYKSGCVPYGYQCESQDRYCNNGILSGNYVAKSCYVNPGQACYFNGKAVPHGYKVKAYTASSVPHGQTCDSIAEERVCNNGQWGGNPYAKYTSCSMCAPAACSFNGQMVPHNATTRAYATAIAYSPDSCREEYRTCNNGKLSGSYGYPSCTRKTSDGRMPASAEPEAELGLWDSIKAWFVRVFSL